MATMVPGYRHLPGHHCGSTALRNVLSFHGTELSEELVFGLGAGACFYYVAIEGQSPSRFTNGRTQRLEEEFVDITGIPLELRTDEDPARAWAMARAVVDAGRPALLLTDLYHLDHYGRSAHFPGHAVVLAGYDDEVAYLSDTAFSELQTTSLESLARARHEGNPIFPLAGHMLHLPEGIAALDVATAAPEAVRRCAERMVEPPLGEFEGLPALRRFAAEVGIWPHLAPDWQWCARFNYQVIERRGTGGGNFRGMYARFLAEIGHDAAPLAAGAADSWTRLAEALLAASEEDEPQPASWSRVAEGAEEVLVREDELWPALLGEQRASDTRRSSRAS
jgi:hypothetical protein